MMTRLIGEDFVLMAGREGSAAAKGDLARPAHAILPQHRELSLAIGLVVSGALS